MILESKTNIEDVPDNYALEQLRQIPSRQYEFIDKLTFGNQKQIGFIAQEVKEVMLKMQFKVRDKTNLTECIQNH